MIQRLIQFLALTPDPIIPEELPPPQVYILHDALCHLEKFYRFNQGLPYPPEDPEPYKLPPEIEERLDRSIEVLPLSVFKKGCQEFKGCKRFWPPERGKLLDLLATALEPGSHTHKFPTNPGSEALDYNPQKSDRHDAPGQAISREAIGKPPSISKGSQVLKDLKNLPTVAQVKHYALVRKSKTFDYILEQSGRISFARVHEFALHHGNFKASKKGKVVYDRSFAWIERELRLSHRTVCRAFKWLGERKLITKLGPADWRIHKNSVWYVCSSMKQNLKLWSMAGGE